MYLTPSPHPTCHSLLICNIAPPPPPFPVCLFCPIVLVSAFVSVVVMASVLWPDCMCVICGPHWESLSLIVLDPGGPFPGWSACSPWSVCAHDPPWSVVPRVVGLMVQGFRGMAGIPGMDGLPGPIGPPGLPVSNIYVQDCITGGGRGRAKGRKKEEGRACCRTLFLFLSFTYIPALPCSPGWLSLSISVFSWSFIV